MTDGTNTELLDGMKTGTQVITGISMAAPDEDETASLPRWART